MINNPNHESRRRVRTHIAALFPCVLGMAFAAGCTATDLGDVPEDARENGSECIEEDLDLIMTQGRLRDGLFDFKAEVPPFFVWSFYEPDDVDPQRWAMVHDNAGYQQYFMNEAGDRVHRFEWDDRIHAYAYANESIPVVGFPETADMSSFAMLHDGTHTRIYFLNRNKNRLIQGAYHPVRKEFVYGYVSNNFPVKDIPDDADLGGWAMVHDGDKYRMYSYASTSDSVYRYTYSRGAYQWDGTEQTLDGVLPSSRGRDFAMMHDGSELYMSIGEHKAECIESGDELEPGGCTDNGELLGRMAITIEEGLDTFSPHSGASGPTGIFAGNYDYHSAQHGQWARLSMARATGDIEREQEALLDLSEENLIAERNFLVANPGFELPYGRAWMLVLLAEVAAVPGRNTAELRQIRMDSEEELLDWLESNTHRARVNDGSLGQHGSWLFALLMLEMSEPIHPSAAARINALHDTVVDQHRDDWRGRVYFPGDFLHIPSIIDTLDLLRGESAVRTAYNQPESRISSIGNGHIVGEEMTRIWPLAILARTDAAACDLLGQHLDEWLETPQRWEQNFASNSHWTPQFLWMAMALRGADDQ